MITSSLMALMIPQPKDVATSYLNAFIDSLQTIDAHNHTTGKGAKIPSAALSIDDSVNFNGFRALSVYSVQLDNLATADTELVSLFAVNGDLYYRSGSNQLVRITTGAQLSVFDVLAAPIRLANQPASIETTVTGNGYIYYDQDNNRIRAYVAGAWKTVQVA